MRRHPTTFAVFPAERPVQERPTTLRTAPAAALASRALAERRRAIDTLGIAPDANRVLSTRSFTAPCPKHKPKTRAGRSRHLPFRQRPANGRAPRPLGTPLVTRLYCRRRGGADWSLPELRI